jgi:hypothetical protein
VGEIFARRLNSVRDESWTTFYEGRIMAKQIKRQPVTAQGYMAGILDDIDEARAKKLRHEFGQRLWILSWYPSDKHSWLARLSGPGCPETIEQTGRTRSEAISEALRLAMGSKSLPS